MSRRWVQVELPLTLLFSVRGGKVNWWGTFMREEDALKAAGLRE